MIEQIIVPLQVVLLQCQERLSNLTDMFEATRDSALKRDDG